MEIVLFGDHFVRHNRVTKRPKRKFEVMPRTESEELSKSFGVVHQPYFQFYRDLMIKRFITLVSLRRVTRSRRNWRLEIVPR
jgi:hypothetical protein